MYSENSVSCSNLIEIISIENGICWIFNKTSQKCISLLYWEPRKLMDSNPSQTLTNTLLNIIFNGFVEN